MQNPDPHYFDYAASAPPFNYSLERYKEVSQRFYANPSSSHNQGKAAKQFLLEQKEQFCNLLNFRDGRLLLCSSGTEANNTIIEGHLRRNPGGRIMIAENVHSSVWYITEKYKSVVDILTIDQLAKVNPDRLKESLKPDTSLVCINHVCNETGAIQSLNHIALICSERKIKLLVDGAQAIGHIPVDMELIQNDYYSFSAHKFGAGRSFGGLLIRDESFDPLLSGGKQEWGLRAGTENIGGLAAGIVALEESLLIIRQ
jgi:cysteine desulfurase